VGDFTLPAARFLHIHIDLLGPLPTSAGYTYCLIVVDCFTHWPEAIPITAETVAGYPASVARRSEPPTRDVSLSHNPSTPWPKVWNSAFPDNRPPSSSKRLVERFHRTLKAAIMFHPDQQWTEALPLILFGIWTLFKADLQESVAELVYSEPLRIPGELLTPAADPVEPAHLITQLRRHMARLRPVPAARHA
jgi:cleavage and polyadenylation specificity factor subunit 1